MAFKGRNSKLNPIVAIKHRYWKSLTCLVFIITYMSGKRLGAFENLCIAIYLSLRINASNDCHPTSHGKIMISKPRHGHVAHSIL